jgi:hypothetical protein
MIYSPERGKLAVNGIGLAEITWGAGSADKILGISERQCGILVFQNASGAANLICPKKPGKVFICRNESGAAITVKVAGGTGITIADSRTARVVCGESDYLRVTADSAF